MGAAHRVTVLLLVAFEVPPGTSSPAGLIAWPQATMLRGVEAVVD